MDDGTGGGISPFPSPLPVAGGGHGHVNSRASSAVAAASVALILLYLFWKFIWQYRKDVAPRRDDNATSSSSSAQRPALWPRGTTVDPERGENKRMPVPASPVHVDTPSDSGDAAEKAECAVCLVEFGHGGEAGRFVPGCGHGFHAACIEAWFRVRPTCPLCRAAVVVPGLPEPNPGRLERS